MAISRRPAYYEAKAQAWTPMATYGLMGVIGAIYVIQLVLAYSGRVDLHNFFFVIASDWIHRPWTLITATLAHSPVRFTHIIFNGFILFFFGPILERIMGWKWFLIWFFVAGAVASVLQVYLSLVLFDQDRGGLGASGALMMVFGALMVLMPREQILLFGIIPMPFWVAGIGFAALDVLGALNPMSGIGNFAHLSGLAMGLVIGWRIREDLKRRGLRLTRG